MNDLTCERLRELLHYDPKTGKWTWLKRARTSHAVIGAEAGHVDKRGYRRICVDGTLYKAHRFAILYVTGHWPINQVDHKNRLPGADKMENLRPATPSQNCQNRKSANKHGYKGVICRKNGKRWQATMGPQGRIYLGTFLTAEDAARAYDAKAIELYGEFAHLNFPQETTNV